MAVRSITLTTNISMDAISLILDNGKQVSATAKRHIGTTVRRLKFIHGHRTSTLHNKRDNIVNLVIHSLSTPFCTRLATKLARTLRTRKQVIFLLRNNGSNRRLTRQFSLLLGRNISNIMVTKTTKDDSSLQQVTRRGTVPIVFTSHTDCLSSISAIHPSGVRTTRLLARRLVHGKRRQVT